MNRRFATLTFTGFALLWVCRAQDTLTFSEVRVGQDAGIVLPALRNSSRVEENRLLSPDEAAAVRDTVGDIKSFRVFDRQSGKLLGEVTFARGKVMAIKRQIASLQGPESDFAKELFSSVRGYTQPTPGPSKTGPDVSNADLIALLAQLDGQRTGTTKITLTDPSGVGDDLKLCLDWTRTSHVCISFFHSKDYGDYATLETIESLDLLPEPATSSNQVKQ